MNGFTAPNSNLLGIKKWSTDYQTINCHKIAILTLQETHLDDTLLMSVHECFGKRLLVINSKHPGNLQAAAGVAFVINRAFIALKDLAVMELVEGCACCIPRPPPMQVLAHLSASKDKSNAAMANSCPFIRLLFDSFPIFSFVSVFLHNVATMYKRLICISQINHPVVFFPSSVCSPVPSSLCSAHLALLASLYQVLHWSCIFPFAVLTTPADCYWHPCVVPIHSSKPILGPLASKQTCLPLLKHLFFLQCPSNKVWMA